MGNATLTSEPNITVSGQVQASTKIPYRRIGNETFEEFMASLKPGEIYEHPETLRLMRKSPPDDVRFPD